MKAFVTELWSTLPNIVTVSITSPSGERTGQIPVRLGYLFDFVFAFERTAVTVEYRLLQENSDAQLVFIRLQKAVPGIWKIEVKPAMQTKGVSYVAAHERVSGWRSIFSGIESGYHIYRTGRRSIR